MQKGNDYMESGNSADYDYRVRYLQLVTKAKLYCYKPGAERGGNAEENDTPFCQIFPQFENFNAYAP